MAGARGEQHDAVGYGRIFCSAGWVYQCRIGFGMRINDCDIVKRHGGVRGATSCRR
jgi:hypothetical protein